MGTTWSVGFNRSLDAGERTRAESAVEAVLAEVDATLSAWNPSSEISVIERNADTAWRPLSRPLHTVLSAARVVSVQTRGAFDVTVAPLVEAWGFGRGSPDRPAPTPAELAVLLPLVGTDRFELRDADRALRRLHSAVRIDLAGIAPGYAVDRISEALAGLGLGNHVVELGGEVRCRGRGPRGRAWRVAIERPEAGTREALAVVELRDLGISTSGDYRDFRVVDGRSLSHTIDPRTGRPVEHALASVSVVHESVMMADAYATALMVLGPRQGLEFAERMSLAALFVIREGDRLIQRGTPSFVRLQAADAPLPATAHN